MLSVIRKYSGSWVIKAMLIAVAVTFFSGWAMIGYFRRGGFKSGEYAAVVNGERIPTDRLEKSYKNLEDRFRQKLGEQFSEELAARLHLKQQALNFLINRELILGEADRLHLQVTDEELRDSLTQFPAFRDADGKFSPTRYQQVLRFQRMTPDEFEGNEKIALQIAKFEHFIKDSVRITDQEVYSDFVRQNERAKIQYLKIGPEDGARRAKVARPDVEKYYQGHLQDFQSPSRRRIAYVSLDPADFKNQITGVSDPAQIEDKANRLAFETAQKLQKDIQGSEKLSALAKRSHHAVKETGLITAGDQIEGSGELATRVFALNPNEISPVISAGGKYYLAQVMEVSAPQPQPLSAVFAEIEGKLKIEKGKTETLALATEALAAVQGAKNLERAARRFNLPLKTTDFFSRGSNAIPDLGSVPELVESAFLLSKEKPLGEKVYPQGSNYYLIALVGRQTAERDKFLKDKDDIKDKLLKMKQDIAFQGYIMNLREQADLKINFELLGEPNPADQQQPTKLPTPKPNQGK